MAVGANFPLPQSPSSDPPGEGAGLKELLGTILGSLWLILATVVGALLCAVLYVALAAPVFRADVLIQIEEKKKGIGGLGELAEMAPSANSIDTEIEILRSRSLVGQVVKELSLDVVARPRFFPVIGAAVARRHRGAELAAPPLGLAGFAWGGERVSFDRLTVPLELERLNLTLLTLESGRYRLLGPDGELLLEGVVGEPASGTANNVTAFVSELRAHPGTRFRVVKRPELEAIEDLQRELVISETRRKTGILRVELSGSDVGLLVKTLDALAAAYVRQNVERKSNEAEKTLEFITSQLPSLKTRVDQAEEALNLYRSKHGTIDVPLENKAAIEESAAIEKLVTEAQLQRAELAQKFTPSHPFVEAVMKKLARLDSERAALNARLKNLPEAELNSVRLLRDVKVSNDVYVLLLNKAQELRVVKSEPIGNVSILDPPLAPREPISPVLGPTVRMALLIGLALGILAAFGRRALHRGVADPEALEAATGLGVYASVPHSPAQARLVRAARKNGHAGASGVLAERAPTDFAVESVRGLRTCLDVALADAPSSIIAIGGPSLGVGKSFIASNLAQVLADSGKRVLLIDGNLRDGHLHRVLGFEAEPGLSEVLAGSDLAPALRHLSEWLDVLTAGGSAPNPSELLMGPRFRNLLDFVGKQYAFVIIDTPSILDVTDAAIISRSAAVTLVVLRAGEHSMREVMSALKRFSQSGVQPAGIVLNETRRAAARGA